jgi:ABC-type amino acid transport substrate-binding protein
MSIDTVDSSQLTNKEIIRIGVKYSPPFCFEENNKWTGLSVNLWEHIAQKLNFKCTYTEYATVNDLIGAIRDKRVDVGIGNVPITSEWEKIADFSHSYFKSSIGAVVRKNSTYIDIIKLIHQFFRPNIVGMFCFLFLLVIVIAFVYWHFEKKKGNPFFQAGPLKGLYNSILWAVLLIFSGQGNPFDMKHRFSQLFLVIFVLFGVTIVSSITALIASNMTLQGISTNLESFDDLKNRNVGVISGENALDLLTTTYHLVPYQIPSLAMVHQKFAENKIDVFIHNREIMQYLITTNYMQGLELIPMLLSYDEYGFVFSTNSALREPVNLEMLNVLHSKEWPIILRTFLGAQ